MALDIYRFVLFIQ